MKENKIWLALAMARRGEGHCVVVGPYSDWTEHQAVVFGESFEHVPVTHFGQLLAHYNVCTRSEARRNGWDFEIPPLFNQWVYGKKHPTLFSVFRPTISCVGSVLSDQMYEIPKYFYKKYIDKDHIKPCALFDLTDETQQQECFHYTNLQPLWAEENLAKGDKYAP